MIDIHINVTGWLTGDVARGWTFFWYVGGFIAGALTSRWAKS